MYTRSGKTFRDRALTVVTGILVGFSAITVADAATFRVPDEAATLQAAFDSASPGDTVLVAPGVYAGDGNRDLVFFGRNLVICSEAGAEQTIIDCGGTVMDPHRAFVVTMGEDTTTVIDGFTIRNGLAPSQMIINNGQNVWYEGGGAILCYGASPKIINCRFEENWAGSTGSSSIRAGGAIFCAIGAPVIRHCVFENNGAYFSGGAIACYSASPEIFDCRFTRNMAGGFGMSFGTGGAIACRNSRTRVENSLLHENIAYFGGGIFTASPISIARCTIVGNSADSIGGGICCTDSGFTMSNSIIAFSLSGEAAGVILIGGSWPHPTLTCSNVYGNAGGDWVGAITYPNGISEDPLFCDMDGENFRLHSQSPCAPPNNQWGQLIGALDVGCTPTAVEPPVSDHAPLEGFALAENYPDPFNAATTISYSVPQRGRVTISIYNVLGQQVRTLVDGEQGPGVYTVTWDGTDDAGRAVASGVYLYRFECAGQVATRKMVLLK